MRLFQDGGGENGRGKHSLQPVEESPLARKRNKNIQPAGPEVTRAGKIVFSLPEDERGHGSLPQGNTLSLGKREGVCRVVCGEKKFLSQTPPATGGSDGSKFALPEKKDFYPPFTRTT